MILGKVGVTVDESFSVLDMANNLVDNIPVTEFTAHLYDPFNNEIYDGSNVTFINIDNGNYKASFVPNQVGNWLLIVYHPEYFPWGKSDDIQVFHNDFDSMTVLLERILGLTQENYTVSDTVYDNDNNMTSSKIKIYSDSASVGTTNNIIAEYNVSASYNNGNLENYSVIKV